MYLFGFASCRPFRQTGGVHPVRSVPAVLRSGLWTAVSRLTREKKRPSRHHENLGEVSLFCFFTFFHIIVFLSEFLQKLILMSVMSRIRRSQSGSPVQFHDPELGDFKRGGYRATAGPRLARSAKTRYADRFMLSLRQEGPFMKTCC